MCEKNCTTCNCKPEPKVESAEEILKQLLTAKRRHAELTYETDQLCNQRLAAYKAMNDLEHKLNSAIAKAGKL